MTPFSVHVPASQHAPAVHALGLPVKQSISHACPMHVTLLPHDMSPEHAMADASARAIVGAGHAP